MTRLLPFIETQSPSSSRYMALSSAAVSALRGPLILLSPQNVPPLACQRWIEVLWVVGRICSGFSPVQKVRQMYFTGEFIDANEAWRLGAIERVVPRAELVAAAMEIAAKIAAKSPVMIQLAKEALNSIEDGDLEAKYPPGAGLYAGSLQL